MIQTTNDTTTQTTSDETIAEHEEHHVGERFDVTCPVCIDDARESGFIR